MSSTLFASLSFRSLKAFFAARPLAIHVNSALTSAANSESVPLKDPTMPDSAALASAGSSNFIGVWSGRLRKKATSDVLGDEQVTVQIGKS
jgi:hypothetical protein